MPQNTNLNVNPYYDDFDEKKNYYKVLFKPGVTVQTRELNNLQSILQNQIEKFGRSFYVNGGIVVPGNFAYDSNFTCVEIESTYKGISVEDYFSKLIGFNIKGKLTGITAKIEYVLSKNAIESEKGTTLLFVKYQRSSSNDFNTETFQNGEELTLESDVTVDETVFYSGQSVFKVLSPLDRNSCSVGSAAKIDFGVYFIRGYFVNIEKDLIVLEAFNNIPTYRVGLQVIESIVDSNDDIDLVDNSQGFSNYAAPGADRLEISLKLIKKSVDNFNDDNFIELFRVINGNIKKMKTVDQFSFITDTLARRTYEESGHYYVSPFKVESLESLNDRLGNSGVFLKGQKTFEGRLASNDLAVIKVSPGKAYVKGYEVPTGTEILDFEKPRKTKKIESSSSNFYAGNLLKLNNIKNLPNIGLTTSYSVSLYNTRLSNNVASGTTIGLARIYDFEYNNTSYENPASQSNLYLFDIQTYTNLVTSSTLSNVIVGNYIKGQYSNASGYIKSISGQNITLYQVSGSFIQNEPLIISGISTTTSVTSISDYSIQDIKSVSSGSFTADCLLSKETQLTGPFNLTVNGGIGTISKFDGSSFASKIKINDIIKYTRPGITSAIFCKVSSISGTNTNISVVGVSTVNNVCDGNLGITTSISNIIIGRPEISNYDDSSLYSKLNNNSISEISFINSNIFVKKYYQGITITSNSVTLPNLSNTDFVYAPFDEERYCLIDDNGNNLNLTTATFTLSSGGKIATISGLSVATASAAKVITTQIKSNISSKYKKLKRVNSVLINNTKYNPSRNVGLAYTSIYGLRVEDPEISLNVPDIVEIHGIYQSSTRFEPQLPSITFSGADSSNIILGEIFIGETSGAVGMVVTVNANNIFFVLKSDSQFVSLENITFQESATKAKIESYTIGDLNISSQFDLDNGQRKHFYDFGRLIRKQSSQEPSAKIKIIFDYFDFESTDNGDVISANSYPNSLNKNKIPILNGVRNSDTIDIRPRVLNYNPETKLSPFEYQSRNFSLGSNNAYQVLASNESFIFDYSFYLPRIDKLTLNGDGNFNIVLGEPSEFPTAPGISEEVLDVATIISRPFVYDVKNDINIVLTDNKRYTMSNLRDIEKRIESLEYYTSLSLLEVSTKNLLIEDSEGMNRFKCGFFVDNFNSYDTSDVSNPIFRSNIENGNLEPEKNKNQINLSVGYSTNLKTTGNTITLDYEEIIQEKQPFASRITNINPFNIVTWVGRLNLNPISDTWTVEISSNINIADVNRRGEVETTQSSSTIPYIRSRNIEFIGTRLKPITQFDLLFDSRNLSDNSLGKTYTFPKLLEISDVIGTFSIGETVKGSYSDGSRISFRLCSPNHKLGDYNNPTTTYNVNPYNPSVGISTLYGPQSTILNIDTSSLQITNESSYYGNALSGMKLYGTSSGAVATVSRIKLVSDDNGTLIGSIYIPDPNESSIKYQTGNTGVKLTTTQPAIGVPGEFTSSAETTFTSSGTRVESRSVNYYDPLAQTFIVNEPEGIFPTSVDIFFATKDNSIPVTVQIREVSSGIPGGSDKIVGSLEKTLNPDQVFISSDASVITNFKFDSLTKLEGGKEYAIIILSDSNEYNVWISRLGEVEISTQNLTEVQKVIINKQPSLGSLFKSQNGSTWVPTPEDDLKFNLKKAKFNTTGGSISFYNSTIVTDSSENKLPFNAIFGISNSSSSYNDGTYALINHPNHGMYSLNNKVDIKGVSSDILPTKLTLGYGITDTGSISVASTENFVNFEGIPVDVTNPGYIKISDEIIKYEAIGQNQLLNITRGIEGTNSLNHLVNSLVYKYEFNNVSLRKINTSHNVIDPTIDSYYIKVESGSFSENKFGGGNQIYASRNKQFSLLEFDSDFISNFKNTNVVSSLRSVSATSVDGSEVSFKDKGFQIVGISSITSFDSPRMVCSRINETTYLNQTEFIDNKSFTLQLVLTTENSNVSPIINKNNSNLIIYNYRINEPINLLSYNTTASVNSNIEDPHSFIYVSKKIELSQSATSLKMFLSAYRSQYSDIRVLYKIYRNDVPDESQIWDLFPGYLNLDVNGNIINSKNNDGRSDSFVPSSLENEYREYTYSIDNLPQFTSYAIKIIGTSNNQSYPVIIENVRSIALR